MVTDKVIEQAQEKAARPALQKTKYCIIELGSMITKCDGQYALIVNKNKIFCSFIDAN